MKFPPFAPAFPLWKTFLAALALLVLVCLVYCPVWTGQFLWDDGFLVSANPFIRSPRLLLECFRHYLFAESVMQFYRPMQNVSYFLDYWRGGLDPSVFHQTNLLLHGANAALLFLLARRWLARLAWSAAFGLAAMWALHPVHSAAVAYVSGRADSLALFFFLLGWWCWEKALDHGSGVPRILFFVAAGLSALLAMCSKEIAAEALLLFVLHLWIIRRELPRRLRYLASLVSLGLFAAYWMLRHLPIRNVAAALPDSAPHFRDRLELFFRALGDYFRLLVWPQRLYMERQVVDQAALLRHPADFDPLFPWLGWLGGLFLILLVASMLWRTQGRRWRVFGALWFLVMILPVSNLFSLNASVAEHWLYFPSIGFLLCLAGCFAGFKLSKKTVAVFVFAALIGFGARTWLRAADWTDALTFYQATIRDGGDSVRMRINLAGEYQKRRQFSEAEQLYRSVLVRMPTYAWVQSLLAENLRAQGRPAETRPLPATAETGDLKTDASKISHLLAEGQLDAAQKTARALYEKNPDSWTAARQLADAFSLQNRPDAALLIVQGFAARHWWDRESHLRMGELQAGLGHTEEALIAWQQVADLDIHDAHGYRLSAALLADSGRFAEAAKFQEKAVARQRTAENSRLLQEITTSGEKASRADQPD